MKILKILGIIVIIFGVADLIGSYTGYDLWTDYIKVDLPDTLWQFSHYIEIAIGAVIFKLGTLGDDPDEEQVT